MIKTSLKAVSLGAIAVATTLPMAAYAQAEAAQAGSTDDDPEVEIVVTGSLIRGTPEDAALPVDVFSNEDLTKAGIDSPLEFIKELPSVGAVLGDTNQFSTDAQAFQGVGSINLRGLGAQRTLVLLNGKRTLQSPGSGFADTNFMPLFALDRIELLKDGAAATYGSDAVAGVANFVTRRNFTGLELQGDYTFIDGSDGNYTLSALAGFDFGDRANLMIGGGWQHRSELATTDRDFANRSFEENPSAFSALSTPGLFAITRIGATGLETTVRPDRGCNDLGGTQTGALCRFTYVPFDNIVEDEDRYQAYAQLSLDLSDRVDFTAEALYARSDLESINYSPAFPPTQGPRGSGFQSAFTTSPANPGVAVFLAQQGLPPSTAASPVVAVTNVLFRPFGFLGNPLDPDRGSGTGFAKSRGYRVSGGFDIELNDNLVLDLDATFWEADRRRAAPGIIGSRLQNALNGLGGANCNVATGTPGQGGCEFFNPFSNAGPGNPTLGLDNPFYVPGNENSAELATFLQVPNGVIEEETQYIFDAVVSGPTGIELGGGPLAFAVGAQYRKNEFDTRPINRESNLDVNPCFIEGDISCVGTATEGSGPFIFLGGNRPFNVSQSVYALFAEVSLPVLDTLQIDGAIRFEDYGGSVGSTVNPKGSARFEATDFLTLRGSVGTTFRGPLASNVAPNSVVALEGFTAAGGNFKSKDIFGNPNDLGPETAFTYNVGAILDIGGLTFSADYFSIDLEDRITTTPGDAIASFVANNQVTGSEPVNCASPLANLVTFSGNQCVQGTTTGLDIARVRTDFVNGPDVKVTGIDFALNYDLPLGQFAVLSAGGNATWALSYEFDDFELQGVVVEEGYDAVGFGNYLRDPNTVPEWRANAYVNLAGDVFNVRYGATYIDGVTDDRCVDRDPCFGTSNFGVDSGSYLQHDLAASYDFVAGPLDLQLQAAIKNFTDEEPGDAQLPLSYNPFIGSAIGRNYRLGLRARF
ncbi:Vitamin B12 transporter BtuB [Alteripontixanthobacter maritimus]|uniref:Vitamin B12 transporter BtuB n=1 Tax=Alteripontixanthobacter maritimus TaxID=2161824 RepID=A0A369Q2P8_9SPHN|nr:TonB-dependent receptor [Alteripontixanthobacter maritimus]RDC59173.1 Vitamin B12 transporter BtuB [Alteripontixanthobacter maritimus]